MSDPLCDKRPRDNQLRRESWVSATSEGLARNNLKVTDHRIAIFTNEERIVALP